MVPSVSFRRTCLSPAQIQGDLDRTGLEQTKLELENRLLDTKLKLLEGEKQASIAAGNW